MSDSIKAGTVSVVSTVISQLTLNVLKIKKKAKVKTNRIKKQNIKNDLMGFTTTVLRKATELVTVIINLVLCPIINKHMEKG